jgi:hypothetical protein
MVEPSVNTKATGIFFPSAGGVRSCDAAPLEIGDALRELFAPMKARTRISPRTGVTRIVDALCAIRRRFILLVMMVLLYNFDLLIGAEYVQNGTSKRTFIRQF